MRYDSPTPGQAYRASRRTCVCCRAPATDVIGGQDRDGHIWQHDVCAACLERCGIDDDGQPVRRPMETASIQARAVAYGAIDAPPDTPQPGVYEWPADPERVAVDRITYHAADDTLAGWQGASQRPSWEQR